MGLSTSRAISTPAPIVREPKPQRQRRELTPNERRVHNWIMQNRGILSRLAAEFGLSVQYVQRIAYDREARSRGMKVERRLAQMGCPLSQKISQ